MTTPDRMAHPRLDIEPRPHAQDDDDRDIAWNADVNERIEAAIAASPTGAVRVYFDGDTDETADVITLAGDGLHVLDGGSDA